MTRVRIDCTTCGTVDLTADDITLELGDASQGVADTLRFTCPTCGSLRRRGADHRVASILLAAGAPRERRITEKEIEAFSHRLAATGTADLLTLLEG